MQEIKTKALALIDKYKEHFASKGIKIVLSKRYIEIEVEAKSGGYASADKLFSIFWIAQTT